ncbi:adenylyl-sulfate kinase [Vibrio sp. SS-MA-C1-2]|uniref:adenylyl-sulfate kinase n=1 Tax=Vibrio sp. SS-MA-C1-2 TaxID=2908646 RepID=UPI001F47994F|nr:adenylyl-sulfate kinase [Vibrio sp. SS-MA-C1-2]UJF18006.1 adenylyl-sulfate kinase [Vibrio sp. SS-MA-C1-2]
MLTELQITDDKAQFPDRQKKSPDVVWHQSSISQKNRTQLNEHQSALLWFTGISGSGKSTIANAVEVELYRRGVRTYLLDGDNVRHGLNSDLGFSDQHRTENIRRVGETGKLFVDAGLIVLAAFISPFRVDRLAVRNKLSAGQFIEIFVDTPIDICEQRDPKGLYQKARKGQVSAFTGIDSTYQPPKNPEIRLESGNKNVDQLAKDVVNYLEDRGLLEFVIEQ